LAAANTEFHPQAEAGTGTGGWVLELSDGGEQAPVRVLFISPTGDGYYRIVLVGDGTTCKYPQVIRAR